MSTNPCHRPKVDSATCSSCSLLPFLFPYPSLLLPFVLSSSSPFLFPSPSLLLLLLLNLSLSLSLSLSFTAEISTFFIPFIFCSLSASERDAFIFLCCKVLLSTTFYSYISYISYGYMVELLVMGGSIGYEVELLAMGGAISYRVELLTMGWSY